jgi:hypothetical protein
MGVNAMVLLPLVCSAMLAAAPADPAADLKAYEGLRAGAGPDAASQVKVALWCEAHGLNAERLKHLARAVLADPRNAAARGLLGLVAFRDRWETPEAVSRKVQEDEALAAKLAQYNARREALEDAIRNDRRMNRSRASRSHVALALWCEQKGLTAEAKAHLTSAVVIDPYNEATWKHLGYVKHNGRWMSHGQIAAEQKENDEQKRADRHWEPLLRKWRGWLGEKTRRSEAESRLDEVTDPRAVQSVARVFASGGERGEAVAVGMLDRIEGAEASKLLARLAVLSPFDAVRASAVEALRNREPRDYVGPLVDEIHTPIKYRVVQFVAGPGMSGAMEVETPRFKMLRQYDAPPAFRIGASFRGYVGYDGNGLPVVARGFDLDRMSHEKPAQQANDLAAIEAKTANLFAQANLKAVAAQQRLMADVMEIEATNAQAVTVNARIAEVLHGALDAPAELKDDEDAWHRWWYDKVGYRYEPPPQVTVEVNAAPQPPPPYITSCFVAGTPVRTLAGHKPIETVHAGDQVLTQDVTTGALSFQPILVVHHNAPGATLRVTTSDGQTVAASTYHRFWIAGKGWSMARDLKAGDTLRTLNGLTKIVSVTEGKVEPLFNLVVAVSRTYFVGEKDTLVHDNTLPDPHLKPFDAEPVLASAGGGGYRAGVRVHGVVIPGPSRGFRGRSQDRL